MSDATGHTPKPSANTYSYLQKLGTNLLDSLVRRFSNPETARRNRSILLICTAILLTLILLPGHQRKIPRYKAGEIATMDVRASQDYLLEDKELTTQLRKSAESEAPIVYTQSEGMPARLTAIFSKAFSTIKESNSSVQSQQPSDLRTSLGQILDSKLTDGEYRALKRIKDEKALLEDLGERLQSIYRNKVILDAKVFTSDVQRSIELHNSSGAPIGTADPSTPFIEIEEARKRLKDGRLKGALDSNDSHYLLELASKILKPNLFFDREATEARKRSAVRSVKPLLYRLQKGEMIVRLGERVTQEQSQKLSMLQQAYSEQTSVSAIIGIFGLVMLLFYFPYRFACKNIRKFNPTNRDILAMAILIAGNFSLFKLALLLSTGLATIFPTVSSNSYYYLFPFAAGAMMVRILLNSEVALVYCAMMAPLLGILFNSNMFVMVYALLGSIVGAHGVRYCQDRSIIYSAGLKVMIVNLAMAFCFQTMDGNLFSIQTLYLGAFAAIGAIISSMIVSAFVPLFETLFHYTTNIKLLELSNLNSPLLHDLMIKAPGTYHHSVIVGNLAEAAAEAIGANPLLARVSAYYHDIGKAAKPQYFIENMHGGENRHDRLSPHMSALILISHVKEGEAKAREKHLGQPIIDVIKQHHGTGLIKFFYEKAKAQAEATGQQVEEQEFRYPGPKPQTREAGLVMLADAIEAASRTLVNPTPDRIQGMVQKLINRIFSEGQLDECELTLKNLHEIAKSFNRILGAIFHHRIEYPEPVHKGTNGGRKPHADSDKEQPEKAQHPAAPAQKSSGDDLKRLGMS